MVLNKIDSNSSTSTNEIHNTFIESKNDVYKYFFSLLDEHFFDKDHSIVHTLWKGSESQNSFCFSKDNDLKTIFNITETDLFDKKYLEAVNGSGKEEKNIKTLHSSALISLLAFYKISETYPLTAKIEGKMVVFTHSRFEVQNPVFTNPSNIDVVLEGHYVDTHKPVVLYLESKFSEYLHNGKNDNISIEYQEIYECLNEKLESKWDLKFLSNNNNTFAITSKKGNCSHYAQGIKQMISHYIGVSKRTEYKDPSIDVYLGSILFDFSTSSNSDNFHTKFKTHFDDYSSLYKELATALNNINKHIDFKVLQNTLTYQELFKTPKNKDILDTDVKQFYML